MPDKPLDWLLKRTREPSSMAGLAALIGAIGIPGSYRDALAQVIVAVLGLLAIALQERGDP